MLPRGLERSAQYLAGRAIRRLGFYRKAEIIDQQAKPFEFNGTFHALRESELRKLPQHKVFLSAGCSGSWYFDWVETCCRPSRHIGVELYSPRPEHLPENCTWIASSISAFPDVPADTVDVVFSGQNLEHLWPDDIVGFLLESRRVLRAGGLLVIDTPNREVTSPMGWCHPEHTAEFTITELHRMLELAGFAVASTTGHWLCRDLDTGQPMPLVPPAGPAPEVVVAQRISGATARPADAFSVWITAHSTGAADAAQLRNYVNRTWRAANTERSRRSNIADGCIVDETLFRTDGEAPGFKMWGPYFPLKAGRHRITWRIRLDRQFVGEVATVDVVSNAGAIIWSERVVDASDLRLEQWSDFAIEVDLPETTFGLEFRLRTTHRAAITGTRCVELVELSTG